MPPITKFVTIYIQLLDEGVEVYRPTDAEPLGNETYRGLPTANYDPEDEIWEFLPGSIVRCEWRALSGGERFVAVALAD